MGPCEIDDVAQMQRDLHDGPLQDVFATMIRLDTIAHRVSPDIADELRMLSALQGRIIGNMRDICRDPRGVGMSKSPHDALKSTVDDASIGLGFAPHCFIDPRIDEVDDDRLIRDLALSLRECLSNIARHAGATQVNVSVLTPPHEVRLRVADNGRGLSDAARLGNGLANLRSRADMNGGTCMFMTPIEGGTVVDWRVSRSVHSTQYGSTGGPDGSSWFRRTAAV